MKHIHTLLSCIVFMFISTQVSAQHSIEFFASNNTGTIDAEAAYQRLTGNEQRDLHNSFNTIMQKNHIEQGKSDDVLGAYQMSGDHVTADNTETFISSPYQSISETQAFRIAQQMAKTLKQESVAVLIPSGHRQIAELQIRFTSRQPTITEAIAMLRTQLPPQYSQAYSLHLTNTCADFSTAKVTAVEWLGSQTNYDEVKKAFPNEDVTYQYGKAYLVYPNGKKAPL